MEIDLKTGKAVDTSKAVALWKEAIFGKHDPLPEMSFNFGGQYDKVLLGILQRTRSAQMVRDLCGPIGMFAALRPSSPPIKKSGP